MAAPGSAPSSRHGLRKLRGLCGFVGLRALSDEELLRHVRQPDIPTFPAVDRVVFFRCFKSESARGPQSVEVVGV